MEQARKRNQAILLIAAGAVIIAGLLIWRSLAPVGGITLPEGKEHPMADGTAVGDPNAPVLIVDYSDFQCSACQYFFANTEQDILTTYVASGQVRFEFHPYILDQNALESIPASEAAYCAEEQGKFWEYHDILFTNASTSNSGGYSNKRLLAFAEAIGLDVEAFDDCLSSNKYRDQVIQETQNAKLLGITATPSFIINGKLVTGALPFSDFQAEIEAALAAAGN